MLLDKVDQIEMEVRELLDTCDFPGDDIPVVFGSALAAVEGTRPEIGAARTRQPKAAVDDCFAIREGGRTVGTGVVLKVIEQSQNGRGRGPLNGAPAFAAAISKPFGIRAPGH